MPHLLRNSLLTACLLCVFLAQSIIVFLLYRSHVEFTSILFITLGLGLTLNIVILKHGLRLRKAIGFAILLAFVAEYAGVVAAFNTYGT